MAGGEGHGTLGPLRGHGSAIDPIDSRIRDLEVALAKGDAHSVGSIARDLADLVREHLPAGWDLERLEGKRGVNDLLGQLDFHESPRHHAAAHILNLALNIEAEPDGASLPIIRTLAAHAREMSSEMLRGHKFVQDARKGHEEVHGTGEQKNARWQQYQKDLERLLERSPQLSVTEGRRRVATNHGVSTKTVKRRTTNPRTKN